MNAAASEQDWYEVNWYPPVVKSPADCTSGKVYRVKYTRDFTVSASMSADERRHVPEYLAIRSAGPDGGWARISDLQWLGERHLAGEPGWLTRDTDADVLVIGEVPDNPYNPEALES